MPEPWRGGNAGVDLFTADNFLAMLEEAGRDYPPTGNGS